MSEVNQQVIADRLGLSRATVSRCFTNHAGISATTRAKVFQLAAEIGYTHLESRSPTAKKSKKAANFTVLICSDTEEYFHGDYESPGEQILAGVSEFAQVNDINIDVNFVPPTATSLDDPAFSKISGLRARKDRGILLIYPFHPQIVEELSLRLPLVSLVEQAENTSIDCVDVDHFAGISAAIDHLISKGHTRIGFYTRDYPVHASWSFRRYSAFTEKMARIQHRIDPKDLIGIFPRSFSIEEGIEEAIARTKDGVTAWVCAADHQAFDLIARLNDAGLKTPEDVSVTGFDGIHQLDDRPDLTTIHIPFRSIGVTGAQRLASRIQRRFGGKQHTSISGKLHDGGTVSSL